MIHNTLSSTGGFWVWHHASVWCARVRCRVPSHLLSSAQSIQVAKAYATSSHTALYPRPKHQEDHSALKQDLAWWRQRCLNHASYDAADEYPVGKAKIPSNWHHLPRTYQSCGRASLATWCSVHQLHGCYCDLKLLLTPFGYIYTVYMGIYSYIYMDIIVYIC